MISFRLFPQPGDRELGVRQQAEDLFAQIRALAPVTTSSGTPLRGQHRQRMGGPGHDFWQYREFQSGDNSRTIDWKQSARTDRILIRQKQKETQLRSSIWLQNDPSVHFSGSRTGLTKYECGSVFALVAAMLCAERHDPFTFAGVGALSVDDLTHVLAEHSYTPSIADLSGHEVFLLGDFLDPLPQLRADIFDAIPGHKAVHIIQILDPVELDLPFKGRTVFEQPQGDAREHILSVGDIRSAYQDNLQAHLSDVRQESLSRNWSYTLIRTGDNYLPSLIDLFHQGEMS